MNGGPSGFLGFPGSGPQESRPAYRWTCARGKSSLHLIRADNDKDQFVPTLCDEFVTPDKHGKATRLCKVCERELKKRNKADSRP